MKSHLILPFLRYLHTFMAASVKLAPVVAEGGEGGRGEEERGGGGRRRSAEARAAGLGRRRSRQWWKGMRTVTPSCRRGRFVVVLGCRGRVRVWTCAFAEERAKRKSRSRVGCHALFLHKRHGKSGCLLVQKRWRAGEAAADALGGAQKIRKKACYQWKAADERHFRHVHTRPCEQEGDISYLVTFIILSLFGCVCWNSSGWSRHIA